MSDPTENLDRKAVAARIRAALKARSGKPWSVTCGRGTAACWITIHAPTEADRAQLAELLGRPDVHAQGVSIPGSEDYYREYIDRAEGRTPRKIAQPYWD